MTLMRVAASTGPSTGVHYELLGGRRAWSVVAKVAASTKLAYRLQGRVGASTTWTNIGSAATTRSSTAGWVYTRSTASVAVDQVRLNVNSYTTSASTAAEGITAHVVPEIS